MTTVCDILLPRHLWGSRLAAFQQARKHIAASGHFGASVNEESVVISARLPGIGGLQVVGQLTLPSRADGSLMTALRAKENGHRGSFVAMKMVADLLEQAWSWRAEMSAWQHEPPDEAACCYHCGLAYNDPGFPDLVVPDDVWRQISPKKNEGGLLCPSCMCRAAEANGVTCEAKFTSGPFAAQETQP